MSQKIKTKIEDFEPNFTSIVLFREQPTPTFYSSFISYFIFVNISIDVCDILIISILTIAVLDNFSIPRSYWLGISNQGSEDPSVYHWEDMSPLTWTNWRNGRGQARAMTMNIMDKSPKMRSPNNTVCTIDYGVYTLSLLVEHVTQYDTISSI